MGVSTEISRAEQAPVTSPGPVHDEPREPTSGEGRPRGRPGQRLGESAHEPCRKMLALAGVIARRRRHRAEPAAARCPAGRVQPGSRPSLRPCGTSPGPMQFFLVHLLGQADKPLLLGGTAICVLGMCGYAASLMRRHPLLPDRPSSSSRSR